MNHPRRPPTSRAAARTISVPRPRRPAKRRSALWRWRRGLFVVGLAGVATVGGVASVVFNIKLPPANAEEQTSFVCAADVTVDCGPNNAIASFSAEEDRINVPLGEIPHVVIDAVLATEDRDFFQHGGVDPVGIARAFYNDVRGRGVQQGGSTITQQYVKNAYLTSERSIARKVKEAVLAVKLERELSKEEILGRYLNAIYFGRGAYGVGAASRAYFGKDIREIGLPEAAYLAGLIRAPEAADALVHPEEASRRRDVTLAALLKQRKVTAEQVERAKSVDWKDLVIARRDRTKLDIDPSLEAIGGTYFIEEIRKELLDKYGEGVLYGGGLRIYVTLDTKLQKYAWDAVTSTLNQPDDPAAALVAVDSQGQVKAMVGGRDYAAQKVNLAMGNASGGSGRGAGSSFKPFTLAAAVQQGISLNSKFNAPAEVILPKANDGKDWDVHNYDENEEGTLDLVDALRVSSNTAFAQLMVKVGPDNVANLARRMGVESPLTPRGEDHAVNSLTLGTSDVSPLDMASGFSTFANRGVHNDPELISRIEQVGEDGDTTLLEQAHPSNDRVLSQQQADLVTYAMRQVVTGGTGRAADIGKSAAGKTGTTQNHRDAWFVGFTPKLTTSVWMGYLNPPKTEPRNMTSVHGIKVTGGSFPAQIWAKFMRNATQGTDQGSFVQPKSFPGKVLNPDLVLTTSSTSSSTSSTLPGEGGSTTSTTIPGLPTTTAPTTPPAPTTTTQALPECSKPFFNDPHYNQSNPSQSTCRPVG
jgi:penicillin-binding protein 1A